MPTGQPRVAGLQHFCNREGFSKIGARIERVKEEGTELARAFAEPHEKAALKYMMRSTQIIEGPHQDGWEAIQPRWLGIFYGILVEAGGIENPAHGASGKKK